MSLYRPITAAMIICNSINAPDVQGYARSSLLFSNYHILFLFLPLCFSLFLSICLSRYFPRLTPPTVLTCALNRIELYDRYAT